MTMTGFIQCVCAFFACVGFGFLFNVRGRMIFTTALGGALGWLAYVLCSFTASDIPRYFVATLVISIYAEVMARVDKVPVIVYLIIALLPLVPGSGMYYTMEYWLTGDEVAFVTTGSHTIMIAGALALGIVLVSSMVRLWKIMRRQRRWRLLHPQGDTTDN